MSEVTFDTDRALKRFWSKVNRREPTECWEWTGSRRRHYGSLTVGGKNWGAHRFSWSFVAGNGPIPEGGVIMHVCDNPPCVNPQHLRLGTQTENNADRNAKGRSVMPKPGQYLSDRASCSNDHPFSESNTYVEESGARRCRTCRSERNRKLRARKRTTTRTTTAWEAQR